MDDYHVVQIKHARDKGNQKNPKAVKLLKKWKSRWPTDGLNVCPIYRISQYNEKLQSLKYDLVSVDYERYYVNITLAL